VGLHSALPERALQLGLTLPVARVIVDPAHCIATGGSFDNGLPFSLSMGCGTWGRNNFSDNTNYRHHPNITRVSKPIPEVVPTEREIFGSFFDRFGGACVNRKRRPPPSAGWSSARPHRSRKPAVAWPSTRSPRHHPTPQRC
jgi:hypothetical protein